MFKYLSQIYYVVLKLEVPNKLDLRVVLFFYIPRCSI